MLQHPNAGLRSLESTIMIANAIITWNVQRVIKDVPPALSDAEILAFIEEQEHLPVLTVDRIEST